jgi:hypothetical protein
MCVVVEGFAVSPPFATSLCAARTAVVLTAVVRVSSMLLAVAAEILLAAVRETGAGLDPAEA